MFFFFRFTGSKVLQTLIIFTVVFYLQVMARKSPSEKPILLKHFKSRNGDRREIWDSDDPDCTGGLYDSMDPGNVSDLEEISTYVGLGSVSAGSIPQVD